MSHPRGRGHVRPSSSVPSRPQGLIRGDAHDGLLAPLRRHRLWTVLGLLVAAVTAGTRFVSIGVLPPSVKLKPFAHATASTQLVVGESGAFSHSVRDEWLGKLVPRAAALGDMIASPEVMRYVAHAAGVPTSKLGVLGPRWGQLQRMQQWANGPKRASQIIVENAPYHVTVNLGNGPLINIETQAPSTRGAARLAAATVVGLDAFVLHLQTSTGVPPAARYGVSQVAPVTTTPPRKSLLINVGVFTFFAVFVLWCGGLIAVSGLMRDLRESAAVSKVRDGLERSSDTRPFLVGTD